MVNGARMVKKVGKERKQHLEVWTRTHETKRPDELKKYS